MSRKVRGPRTLATVWLAIAFALLTAAMVSLYFSTQNYSLSAYERAPHCASLDDAAAGRNCRFDTAAIVTQVTGDANQMEVYFKVPGTYSPYYRATLPSGAVPSSSIGAGSEVQVEIWGYRVTRLGGVATADNPQNDPRPGTFRLIGLLLVPLGLIAVVAARRTWREDQRRPPAETMNPVATSDLLWR
jgi:hypothetical protein